jgi:hypothetical protein
LPTEPPKLQYGRAIPEQYQACEIGKLGGEEVDFPGKVVIAQRRKAATLGDIGY